MADKNESNKKDKGAQGKGISVSKEENFSDWYSELIQKAELADMRYNVKGFICYLPWSTITIKEMYKKYESALEKTDHLPLVMPSVIPESNFLLEADHVEGFAPEVFWVTETGDGVKLQEKLALRPTSETALYKMYSYWVRSYNDLPFKRYQSCQVWRAEATKATRPFLRAREFHWIEAHNVFATLEDAKAQVLEDMNITYDMLENEFAIPIIFFQRPEWDKFPGAVHTYAADALMDSGKVLQLPSTHLLGQNFSKPFNVKFMDADGVEKYGFITCYGPAISRIYGAMISVLGDDQGLILPFDLAPKQIVVVPILFKGKEDVVLNKCNELVASLKKDYSVHLDLRDINPGEKYNHWELKGVPIRIEVGPRDVERDQVVVVLRTSKEKQFVPLNKLDDVLLGIKNSYTNNLRDSQKKKFDDFIVDCASVDEIKKAVDNKKMARVGMCSIGLDAAPCAEIIEKQTDSFVRGSKVGEENTKKVCVACSKPATVTVYVAKSY
ncbi:MAG: proline--tRNA ligase [Candidatus Woesearchaeota archaeon]